MGRCFLSAWSSYLLDVDLFDPTQSRKPCSGYPPNGESVPRIIKEISIMSSYRFSVIIPAKPLSSDEILDATDALGNAGCTDASIRGHAEGIELLFEREADSLQSAISSAVADAESAGYKISKIELEREAIPS